MDEKKMKELMIDYIDGKLTGELKVFVAKHIEKNEQAKKEFDELKETMALLESDREFEPDNELKLGFLDNLEREMDLLEKGLDEMDKALEEDNVRVIGFKWNVPSQIAAAVAFVIVGILIGLQIANQNNNNEDLRAEMEQLKSVVIEKLQDEASASQRISGVNTSYGIKQPDKDIIAALVKAMHTDENTNVRLAALDALGQFTEDLEVREVLINSLEIQNDPIVQISLINLMVQLKETKAIAPLERIIQNDETLEMVKDEAHIGLFSLI
ncbi:MAG: HEAT repeat domain-containing protein [Bacteroidota bacterium]